MIQIQQAELQIKAQEAQTKQMKAQSDAQARAQQMAIEQERIASQERIAGMQINAKVQKDNADLQIQREIEAARLMSKSTTEANKLGVDIAKHNQMMSKQTNRG